MLNELFLNFMNKWHADSESYKHYRSQNKNKGTTGSYKLSKLESCEVISKTIPEIIYDKAFLLSEQYEIKGSYGQGALAEIPSISILDKEITTSSMNGYYIVYLFCADMSGFYLTFNQGISQYKVDNNKKYVKDIIVNTSLIRNKISSINKFSIAPIDLKSSKRNHDGEIGCICSKFYSVDSIPSDKILLNDLREMISIYSEVKAKIGPSIIDVDKILDEDEFQHLIQFTSDSFQISDSTEVKDKLQVVTSRWPRNPKVSALALESANYECEVDENHQTFLLPNKNNQYMEGHHLIPIEFQNDYDVSIDIPENIISLCPNCHRAFHYGQSDLKRTLVQKFYDNRNTLLSNKGIHLKKEDLFTHYGIADAQ